MENLYNKAERIFKSKEWKDLRQKANINRGNKDVPFSERISMRSWLRKQLGVSDATAGKIKLVYRKASEKQKQKLREGKVSVHSVYLEISRICPAPKNFIYFVKYPELSFVKIGFTRNLQKRLIRMQGDCPLQLKLLAVSSKNASRKKEKLLHKRFNYCRVRGEWFKMNKDLKNFIKEIIEDEGEPIIPKEKRRNDYSRKWTMDDINLVNV